MDNVSDRLHNNPALSPGPTLTVIVPVFNEADTIDLLLQQVLEAPYDKQIIVVDDGSTDGTEKVLGRWRNEGQIEVLTHPHNRGKGAAIRTALPQATGRFTIIQDGDLETDPQDYPWLIEPLLRGEAEFVIGSRFLDSGQQLGRLSFFRWGVLLLNWCVRLLYGVRLTDEACCYKALPTPVFQAMDLQCERFEFCPEVVAKACSLGLQFQEVPIRYYPRDAGAGKKIRYRDGFEAIFTLWRYRKWTPIVAAVGFNSVEESSREPTSAVK